VNCKDISCDKIMQEQPNDKNNLVNSLIPQQNEQQSTSLKRKRSTVSYSFILLYYLNFRV